MSNVANEVYTDSNGSTVGGYVIEHNVPLPQKAPKAKKEKKPRQSKYPFAIMQVNDSVFLDGLNAKTVNSALQVARKKLPNTKWTVRSVEGGVRVWRLA